MAHDPHADSVEQRVRADVAVALTIFAVAVATIVLGPHPRFCDHRAGQSGDEPCWERPIRGTGLSGPSQVLGVIFR